MDYISPMEAYNMLPFSLSRSGFYNLIKSGRIPSHRCGRKIYIKRSDLSVLFSAAQVAA